MLLTGINTVERVIYEGVITRDHELTYKSRAIKIFKFHMIKLLKSGAKTIALIACNVSSANAMGITWISEFFLYNYN